MQVGSPIIYCPLANTGHYNGSVTAVRSDGTVDIEISDSGPGDPLRLSCIAVVPNLRDLKPATCTELK